MGRGNSRGMTEVEKGVEQELYRMFDAGQPATATTIGSLFSMPKRATARILRELRHRADGQSFGMLAYARAGDVAARTAATRAWVSIEALLSVAKPRIQAELLCRWAATARPELAGLADGAVAVRLVGLNGRAVRDQVEPDRVVGVSVRRSPDGGIVAGLHRLVAVPGGVTVSRGSRVALFGVVDPGLALLAMDDPFMAAAVAAVGDLETEGPSGDPVWPSLIATMPAEEAAARMAEPTPEAEELALDTLADWVSQGRPDAFPQSPSLPAAVAGVTLPGELELAVVTHRVGTRWSNLVRGVVMDWLAPVGPAADVAIPLSFLRDRDAGRVSIDLTTNWSGVVTMSASAAYGVEAGWAWDLA